MRSRMALVPRSATLDGFADAIATGEGVNLHDLDPLTALLVYTSNSVYRIVVSRRTAIVIQGGPFFREMTEVRLHGSSAGGSLLRVAWIGVGLCMEISAGGQRIVTSRVRAIMRQPAQSSPSYCH
jgi:hypothetical protein